MRTDGRVDLLASRLDGVLMSGLSAECEAENLLRLIDGYDRGELPEFPPQPPMTFRLVATNDGWQVHTAVRPQPRMEVTFTVGIPV